jgi:anti-sigma B factor antagonist
VSIAEPSLYEPFTVTVVPDRDEVAVVPAGELDLSTCHRIEEEVHGLRVAGFDRVIVDLRRVTFVDSTTLRVLLGLRNEAERDGHAFTLLPGPEGVQRVFEVTGTRELFDWRVSRTPQRPYNAWRSRSGP